MKLKIFFPLFLFSFLFSNPFFSQSASQDSLNQQIKTAVEAVVDEGYIRIPKKDFEEIVENQLSNMVSSEINTWVGAILAIITLLSAFSIFQFKQSREQNEKLMRALISAEVHQTFDEAIKDFKKDFRENIEKKMMELEKRTGKDIAIVKNENINSLEAIHIELEKARTQVIRAEDYMTNLELENLGELIKARKYKYPEDFERTKILLEEIENSKKKTLVPEVVNLLSYIHYNEQQYNEVNDLISKYEKEYKLKSTTYINGALTAFADYFDFNARNQRDKALEYLNKSLELTQGFGEAQGLKLEVFMMDFVRAKGEKAQNEALQYTSKVLDDILLGSSPVPSYETVSRLLRDFKIEPYQEYILPLFKEFPEKMRALFQKAEETAKKWGYPLHDISDFLGEE